MAARKTVLTFKCCNCGVLPAEAFFPSDLSSDRYGNAARCRKCSAEYVKARRHNVGRKSRGKNSNMGPKTVYGIVPGFDGAAASECRWIEGDPREPGARFCGDPVTKHRDGRQSSYCRAHHKRCWVSPNSRTISTFEPTTPAKKRSGLFARIFQT